MLVELLRKVRQATEPSGGPERPLAAHDPAGRIEAILAEIDETVLPRALIFEVAGTGRVVIECRERHAVRIADCTVPIEGTLSLLATIGATESPAEARREALATLLAGLCRLPGALSVQSRPSGLSASVVDKGFAPTDIKETAAVGALWAGTPAAAEPAGRAAVAPPPPRSEAVALPDRPRPAAARADAAAGAAGRSLAEIAAALAVPHAAGRADGRLVTAETATGTPLPAQDFAAFAAQAAETAAFFEQAVGGAALIYVASGAVDTAGLCFALDGEQIAAVAVTEGDLAALAQAWQPAGASR